MNNFYGGMYNPQMNIDRINRQIEDLNNLKNQMQNPPQMMSTQTPAINQTFQLSNPQSSINDFDGKYAKDIEEVKNTLTLKNTFFVDKDINTLWFKDVSGKIRTFTLTEVVELDEKDKEILALKQEIENMKGMILNAKSVNVNADESTERSKSSNVSSNKSSSK